MSPSLFLSALRARMGLFMLAVGITVLAAAVLSLMLTKTYRATASLVIDTREEQSFSNALNAFTSPSERTSYMQTQVDIIQSPKVARKVVDNLRLAEQPRIREAFAEVSDGQTSIEDWLVNRMRGALSVGTSQSSILHISYEAASPQQAATIANEFAKAYMDTMLELRVEPTRQAAVWFDEQLQTLRADLEKAQARMTQYQQEHGIVSTNENLDEEYARLNELSAQLLRAQEATAQLRAREELARQVVEQDTALERLPEIQSDPYFQQLSAALVEGEARLQRLTTQYGPNHPEYQRQLAENRSRAAKLEAETQKILAATENERRQSEQREANIRAALEAQRARVLELKESRDELSVLMRNVDTSQNAYDTAMQRFVVSQVESRASQTNVAMLSPALTPTAPHSPNLLLNLALALFVGTALGGGLVTLMEITDRRVRSPMDLVQAVDVPVLGELNAWKPSEKLLLAGPAGSGSNLPAHT